MTLLSANQIAYIFRANDNTYYTTIEWSRPFGLDVLVWGFFIIFFSCTYKPNTIHHFELIY